MHHTKDLFTLQPLIIDHDIGTNPDDVFAFDFVLKSPRANLLFTVSGNREPVQRARLARLVLDLYGREDVTSYAGEEMGCAQFFCQEHIAGVEHYETDYIAAVEHALQIYPSITYLAIQGLSNLAEIFRVLPEANDRLHIVHMGLSTSGTDSWNDGGTNMKADQKAAKFVYQTARHVKAVGLQTTLNDLLRLHPGNPIYTALQTPSSDPRLQLLRSHLDEFVSRRSLYPAMHDPLAASVALGYEFVDFEQQRFQFNEDGLYKEGGDTEVQVSLPKCRAEDFMELLSEYFRMPP